MLTNLESLNAVFIEQGKTNKEYPNLLMERVFYLSFSLEGEGEIIATGNGDATSLISFKIKDRPVFNGKCLVIVKIPEDNTVKTVLKVKGKGIGSGSVEL